MIDHISLGVRDIARAKRFYDATLGPLGYTCLSEDAGMFGYGDAVIALWIGAAERPILPNDKSGLHVCFVAPTRHSVDAFHTAAKADPIQLDPREHIFSIDRTRGEVTVRTTCSGTTGGCAFFKPEPGGRFKHTGTSSWAF